MLITKTKMAEIAGVSQSAIGKACRQGALKSAVCGGKVDVKSEAARSYLRKKDINPDVVLESSDPITKSPDVEFPSDPLPGGDADPKLYEDMTLKQICAIFGTDDRFKHWTSARKTLTEIQRNDIANAKAAGQLFSRGLVEIAFEHVDSVYRKLLTDVSKTISIRAHAIVSSGGDIEEIKAMAVDQIGSAIRFGKKQSKRALENA